MEKADIGLIGLGVMGQNLALNLAGKGWKVAVWNRTVPGKEEHIVDNFIAKRAQGKSIVGTQTLEEFVDALKTPKVVFIIRKSKFPQNPKRSVRFSGKRTKRSVQKRKARNTQKAETKVL